MQPTCRQVPPRYGVLLDEGGLQAQLSGANGGGVSGRAAADDGYVVNGVSQSNAPLYRKNLGVCTNR